MDKAYRSKFFRWLIEKIAKTPEGEKLPSWVNWVWRFLFPMKYIYYRVSKYEGYQPRENIWIIHGVKISDSYFFRLSDAVGKTFKIVKNDNGVLTLQSMDDV